MLIRGKMARNVNEGAFFIKILLIIGAFIGVMYISNDFFMGTFIDICRYVSIVFLAFQALMMIDLLYLWGESWISKYDNGMISCKVYLPLFSFSFYALYVFLLVVIFMSFSGKPMQIMISIHCILCVVLLGLQLAGIRKDASLLTTAGVTVFSTYWMWSALASNSEREQNNYVKNGYGDVIVIELVVSGLMAIVTLLYLTFG